MESISGGWVVGWSGIPQIWTRHTHVANSPTPPGGKGHPFEDGKKESCYTVVTQECLHQGC